MTPPAAPSLTHLPRSNPAVPAALFVILLVALFTRLNFPEFHGYFDDDEVGYATAMGYGFPASYLGTHEESGLVFILQVVHQFNGAKDSHIWRDAYLRGDASALRHMHAPVGLYPASPLLALGITREETLRLIPLALSLLACLGTFLLTWTLTRGPDRPARIAASLLAMAITADCDYNRRVAVHFSFHAAYNLFSLLTLVFLTRAAQSRSIKPWYIAVACLSVCVLTIEYWVLLVPAALFSLWVCRGPAPGAWKRLLRAAFNGLAILIACLTLLWPPFIWSLGFVKPVLIFGGLMLHPLPASGFDSWLIDLALTHSLLVAMLLFALPLAWRFLPRDRWRALGPCLIYMAFFILINARVAHMKPLYAAQIIPVAAAVAAVSVWLLSTQYPKTTPRLAAAVLVLFLAVTVYTELQQPRETPTWRQAIQSLAPDAQGKTLLVINNFPVFQYYLPAAKIIPDPTGDADIALAHKQLAAGQINWVIYRETPPNTDLAARLGILSDQYTADSILLGTSRYTIRKKLPPPTTMSQ